ncbi:MAG: glutaredoxin family protein [Candidatus Obscuribacterales bacterium]
MLSNLFKRNVPKPEPSKAVPAATETDSDELPDVIIYTTGWCYSCKLAKRYLQDQGIAYQEIDIESIPGAAKQVETWARGYRTVPTFVIGKTVVVDWNRKTVERTLKEAGFSI